MTRRDFSWTMALVVPFVIGVSSEGCSKEPGEAAQHSFSALRIEKLQRDLAAPDFELESLSGKRVSLKGLKEKVVFVNFWATWCIPCLQEMPKMEKLHRELQGQGLEVVAINMKESREEVKKFFDEHKLTFTVLLDRDGKVAEKYGAWGIPLTYIIDRKGIFVGRAAGYREWDSAEAKAFFSELLSQASAGNKK